MPHTLLHVVTIDLLHNQCKEVVSAGIKTLLESKHLYQTLLLDFSKVEENARSGSSNKSGPTLGEAIRNTINAPWAWEKKNGGNILTVGTTLLTQIVFDLPLVRLFCTPCGRTEAFDLLNITELLTSSYPSGVIRSFSTNYTQVFSILGRCAACHGLPNVFLVRREGRRLSMCGRIPIEVVDVPKTIPKEIRKFYSDAIVAMQSGQVLAGNFLLRAMIEQWARHVTKNPTEDARDVLEKFVRLLPSDFKERFPVLSSTYSNLSSDIHRAAGAEDVFQTALEEIRAHFDARHEFNRSKRGAMVP